MIEKYYTYADLPEKGHMPEVQHRLDDGIILEQLNKIVENSNLLISIDYTETYKSDELTIISINFLLAKKQ